MKDQTAVQLFFIILTGLICIAVLTTVFLDYFADLKCDICQRGLWSSENKNQLKDTWTCAYCWSTSVEIARRLLRGEYLRGKTDDTLNDKIVEVIKGRT